MIYLLVAYVIFLAFYLPFNFYIVFRVHEMRLSHDHAMTVISFVAMGIAVVVFVSLITIAAFDWPVMFSIFSNSNG